MFNKHLGLELLEPEANLSLIFQKTLQKASSMTSMWMEEGEAWEEGRDRTGWDDWSPSSLNCPIIILHPLPPSSMSTSPPLSLSFLFHDARPGE
jgi:hypothetical protein